MYSVKWQFTAVKIRFLINDWIKGHLCEFYDSLFVSCPLMRRLFLVSTDPGNPTYERCPLTRDFQDSLGFGILRRGFQIPGTGFLSLSVELRCWIPIVSGIPESLSCIPDSKTQDFRFLNQNFRRFRIPLHEGIRKVPAYKRFPGWQFGVC